MACSMLLALLVLGVWVFLPKQVVSQSLFVPGLRIGATIIFGYWGEGLSRVTLSIEDSIGKALHMAMRLNEECEGNPPELLLNSKTDGVYGDRIMHSLHTNFLYWNVTAEETDYCIDEYLESGEVANYEFPYRDHHQLSDVKVVKLYASKLACDESGTTSFEGTVFLHQPIPQDFLKVVVLVKDPMHKGYAYLKVVFTREFAMTLVAVSSVMRFVDQEVELDIPYTDEMPVELVMERIDTGKYKATASVNGQSLEYEFADPGAPGILRIYFMDIMKLDVD